MNNTDCIAIYLSDSLKIQNIDHEQMYALKIFRYISRNLIPVSMLHISLKISPIRHSCLAIYPNNEVLRDCKAICVDNILQYLLPLCILYTSSSPFKIYFYIIVKNIFSKKKEIYSNHLAFLWWCMPWMFMKIYQEKIWNTKDFAFHIIMEL